MPFKSKAQERYFQAVAHNAKLKNKGSLTKEVAEKFIHDSEGEPKPKKERFSKLKKKMGGK